MTEPTEDEKKTADWLNADQPSTWHQPPEPEQQGKAKKAEPEDKPKK